MSSSKPIGAITLKEDDVPGGKLLHENVADHSSVQLQRWLKCRGLKNTGLKPDLVKRVEDALVTGITAIDPAIDDGKWYDLKQKTAQAQATQTVSSDIPVLPISGWSPFPSGKLPTFFNYGHIYHFMVTSIAQPGEDFHTNKPLEKGKSFFTSGHIQEIQDQCKNNFYFTKCKVMSSFVTSKFYFVTAVICMLTGFVKDTSCTCVASSLGRCNHVAGLLFALDDYINKSATVASSACTSLPCQWNKGRSQKKTPQRVNATAYGKSKKPKILFDPRNVKDSTEQSIQKIKEMAHSLNKKSCWASLFMPRFSDYIISPERIEFLTFYRTKLLEALKVNVIHSHCPTEIVKDQGSYEWFIHRAWRLTSSNAKAIFTARNEKSIASLINRIIWTTGNSFCTNATEYGRLSEPTARIDYIKYLHTVTDKDLTCLETGLWVSGQHPQLACSPDGIVKENGSNDFVGIVEIKCPFVLKGRNIHKFKDNLTESQLKTFCLTHTDTGEIILKPNHSYYYQIQAQMGVMGVQWCDFVVWSEVDIFVQRITLNSDLWRAVCKKMLCFYNHRVSPELAEMRVPRKLLPMYLPGACDGCETADK